MGIYNGYVLIFYCVKLVDIQHSSLFVYNFYIHILLGINLYLLDINLWARILSPCFLLNISVESLRGCRFLSQNFGCNPLTFLVDWHCTFFLDFFVVLKGVEANDPKGVVVKTLEEVRLIKNKNNSSLFKNQK